MEEYINKWILDCEKVLKYKNIEEAKKLQELIISTFRKEIYNIEEDLTREEFDVFQERHIMADYIGNIEKLKNKLEWYRVKSSSNKENVDKGINISVNNSSNNSSTNNSEQNNDFSSMFEKSNIQQIDDNSSKPIKKSNKIKSSISWLLKKIIGAFTAILKMVEK